VLFLRSGAEDPAQSLFEYELASGRTRELLSPAALLQGAAEHLSEAEKARRERQRVTARGFTAFELSDDGKLLLVTLSGKLYAVSLPSGTVKPLPAEGVIDPKLAPDAKHVAYVRERDLYVLDLASLKERRLTHSDSPTVTNGLAEFVAQEEMYRYSGYWWSGDSRQIAYEQADAAGVETLHVFDTAHPERAGEPTFYPRPGTANVKVKLGVVGVDGGATNWIPWDASAHPYLVRVEWKDQAPLTFGVMDRRQRELVLYAVEKNHPRELLREHDDKWVNLDPTAPRWLSDGSAFLWSTERAGGWQLELRDRSGKLERTLTQLSDGYEHLVDADEHSARFAGGPDPTEVQLYEVPLRGGPVRALTGDPGVHEAHFGHEHRVWVDRLITESHLFRSFVHGTDGLKGELPSVAETPPFASHSQFLRVGPEQFSAVMTRPRDFDPKKRYPVLVYVYGGPHHIMVERRPALFQQWLADHGAVVFSFDGRGTPRRGRDWERHIAGDFSRTLDDQVTALRALGAAHPELDLSRVGIYGWSFGGWLSALAVLERPDVFQVAMAGAPPVDWTDYDTFYTERYLDLPEKNPEGYRKSSLLTYAPSLSRPLLLVHGTADDNVYFFHTLKLADALFRAGRPFSLLPLVGLTHMVPDPVVVEQLWTRIAAHLLSALK
jgi:dipeptidyl-peptidase-4